MGSFKKAQMARICPFKKQHANSPRALLAALLRSHTPRVQPTFSLHSDYVCAHLIPLRAFLDLYRPCITSVPGSEFSKTSFPAPSKCTWRFFTFVLCGVAQSCLIFCDPMDCSPPRLLCPWNSPGKNNEVGSHSLLQWTTFCQSSPP